MSCCQTVQNNRVLSMLASTHFHILPYFSSFSVLPTPTYHPLRMLTVNHQSPITRSSSSTHDSVPAQWAWRLLVCRVSLLVCLHPLLPLPPWGDPWHSWPWCFKGSINECNFQSTQIISVLLMAYTIPINQTLVNPDSAFMVCHSRFK